MTFKIIAITPLKGCSETFIKLLTPDKPYLFYHNFEFKDNKLVEKESNVPPNLYGIASGHPINISAIVGKNGTGKSTVIELLYALMFNVAYEAGILPKTDDNGKAISRETGLKAIVTYQMAEIYYQIRYDGKTATYRKQLNKENNFGSWYKISKNTIKGIDHLFYSVVMNYSHHSLNSNHQPWLRYIFHKNDGYQTPIVINPFREGGIINMDREEELTNARIVTSLLTLRPDGEGLFNELTPGKVATHLKFTLNPNKTHFERSDRLLTNLLREHRDEILTATFAAFKVVNRSVTFEKDRNLEAAYSYIGKKLYNITRRYLPYKDSKYAFISSEMGDKGDTKTPKLIYNHNRLKLLLKKIVNSPSHITFKLQQAVNFVSNIDFFQPLMGKFQPLEIFAENVNQFRTKATGKKQALISVIPPSFFTVDIKFSQKNDLTKTAGRLQTLSSGERQNIYSSASWMYHIINLISVRAERESGYRRYQCINIVFDEIELYYHPEMQRDFLQTFLWNLGRLGLNKDWGINCIFITHSPFVLSDIHNQQIMFLGEDGLPVEEAEHQRTFAANIHELLRNHFFLRNGTMGAFARAKVNSLIAYLTVNRVPGQTIVSDKEWSRESADQFIEMVSEPLIRQSLRTLYNQYFLRDDEIREEITKLEAELRNRRS